MKRFLAFALPVFGVFLALGVGLFVFRTQGVAIRTRFGTVEKAVADVVEEVGEEVREVLE